MIELIVESDDPNALIEELIEFVCFDHAMAGMRKHYSPQGGKGSQSDEGEWGLHTAVFEAVGGIFAARRKEREEWD